MSRWKNQKAVVAILLLILVLVVFLRVFNLGHVLIYDEAWNINSMMDGAKGYTAESQTSFFGNFYRHPPMYTGLGILYAKATGTGRDGLSVAMELMSLMFAALLVVAIFLCGRDWFGDTAALVAAFLFALAPAARVYDTFVKQESLTLLFLMLFLLFFFRSRYLVAGVFLGLAMLTKEIFVFVLLALLIFVLLSRRRVRLIGYLKSVATGLVLSCWWYVFFSSTTGEFTNFFLGRSTESLNWRQPWYYYIKNLPHDLGWVFLFLVLTGVIAVGWSLKGTGQRALMGEDDGPRQNGIFLVVWIALTYLLLSISLGKPPWMVYSVLPAFALLAGLGVSEAYRVFSVKYRSIAAASVIGVLLLALGLSVPVGLASFMKSDRSYLSAQRERQVADYINRRTGASGTVALKLADLSPPLAFYLDSYHPGSMTLLPKEATGNELISEGGKSIYLMDSDVTFDTAKAQIKSLRPHYLVLRYRSGGAAGDLARSFAALKKPVEIDGVLIFDSRALLESL